MQTRWSVVLGAKEGCFEALSRLCEWYREPLRRHILRRGFREGAADDLIQDFLAKKLVEGTLFASVQDPREVGETRRFRTFLLTCLDRFLTDRRRRRPDPSDPDRGVSLGEDDDSVELAGTVVGEGELEASMRADWVEAVLRLARERHREEYLAAGKPVENFEALDAYYQQLEGAGSGLEMARRLGMTENAFYVAKHRFAARRTYWLREVVRETVSNPDDWEQEVRELLGGTV